MSLVKIFVKIFKSLIERPLKKKLKLKPRKICYLKKLYMKNSFPIKTPNYLKLGIVLLGKIN